MNCDQIEALLLQVETIEAIHDDMAEHVRGCPRCSSVWQRTIALEKAWRELPLPAEHLQARDEFLKKWCCTPASPRPAPPRRRARMWASLSVALLLLLGIGTMFFFQQSPAAASADLLSELVEWNVELSDADPQARATLFALHHEKFRKQLVSEKLPEEERILARRLLENGAWLAQEGNADATAEVERFDELAEQLQGQMEKEVRNVNPRGIERTVVGFHKIHQQMLKKIKAAPSLVPSAELKKRWESLSARGESRDVAFRKLQDRSPERARQEIRRVVSGFGKGKSSKYHK